MDGGQVDTGEGSAQQGGELGIDDAEGIRPVLVDGNFQGGHPRPEIIVNLVTSGFAEGPGDGIGKLAQGVRVISADPDLDRRLDRRTLLQWFDDAACVGNPGVELAAEPGDESRHFPGIPGVHDKLRQVPGRSPGGHIIVEPWGGSSDEHASADNFPAVQEKS